MADEKGTLASNEIVVAEGTDHEKKITLKIPRGKQHRKKHMKLMNTFGKLQSVFDEMQDGNSNVSMGSIFEAIEDIFTIEKFEDEMVPFVLGINPGDKEMMEWCDELLPLEKFTAYMEAAGYILTGGNTKEFETAIKK